MKERAFARQQLYPQDNDHVVLQHYVMVRFVFHWNRRLLCGTEIGQHERQDSPQKEFHRIPYRTGTPRCFRIFTTWSSTRCATSHFEVSGTSTTSLREMIVTAFRSESNPIPVARNIIDYDCIERFRSQLLAGVFENVLCFRGKAHDNLRSLLARDLGQNVCGRLQLETSSRLCA